MEMVLSSSLFLAAVIVCSICTSITFAQMDTSPPLQQPQYHPLTGALQTLSDSGYVAMSLTIELIAKTLISSISNATTATTPSLTIFSPPDSVFEELGQPSLRQLLLQFSPLALSMSALGSQSVGSEIPNLSPSGSLYISCSSPDDSRQVSINGVNVSRWPVFDDGGPVIAYAVDNFFPSNFSPPKPATTNPRSVQISDCKLRSSSLLHEASITLKSRGYSTMASFLDLQLFGFASTSPMKLTVFAPVDEALVQYTGNIMAYQSVLIAHVLPCVVRWSDLKEIGKNSGAAFMDYANGFSMNVSSGNGEVYVNGVRISVPDMYSNDWIVIHGLNEMIPLEDELESRRESNFGGGRYMEVSAPDHNEF
ncbi:unnamed protein product [Cuscuta epithymum]|uniref:FAS1 domain-containing protein n=1 Tax=Cuscuta epithymum TaxID=186058 RepID=A0AAV0C6X5_9ASTE|nr:unnamed protein product [Cuscuta epithymum]